MSFSLYDLLIYFHLLALNCKGFWFVDFYLIIDFNVPNLVVL
jgi:hypothetical protein